MSSLESTATTGAVHQQRVPRRERDGAPVWQPRWRKMVVGGGVGEVDAARIPGQGCLRTRGPLPSVPLWPSPAHSPDLSPSVGAMGARDQASENLSRARFLKFCLLKEIVGN